MKAIQIRAYGGPDVIEHVDVPDPEPGPGEVLVKAHSLGVGYPDVLLRTGVYKWKPALPTILGNEMSGHIAAIGEGVDGFEIGQPVLVFGTGGGRYAEYNAVSTDLVTRLPDTVDMEAAVTIPNYLVAWAMVHGVAHPSRVSSAYINGAAGGMGTALLDLCRSEGIATVAGASTDEKCRFVEQFAPLATVNYTRDSVPETVLGATNGRGVDVSFDQLGGPAFVHSLDMLAPLGLVILYNAVAGPPDTDLFAGLRERRGQSVGVQCFSLHAFDRNQEAKEKMFADVIARFAEGAFSPPICDRLPMRDARRAHEMMDDRRVLGKLILKP